MACYATAKWSRLLCTVGDGSLLYFTCLRLSRLDPRWLISDQTIPAIKNSSQEWESLQIFGSRQNYSFDHTLLAAHKFLRAAGGHQCFRKIIRPDEGFSQRAEVPQISSIPSGYEAGSRRTGWTLCLCIMLDWILQVGRSKGGYHILIELAKFSSVLEWADFSRRMTVN